MKIKKQQKKLLQKTGWFKTGDLATIDNKGYIRITGRIKDMIVLRNGKKIFPEEIEYLINKLPYVKESFVYLIEDKTGEQVRAKIVYDEEYVKNTLSLSPVEIEEKAWEDIKEINKSLPIYKYIKKINVTNKELEKTTTLKIKRHIEFKKIEEELEKDNK